jgi:hypothetical protein
LRQGEPAALRQVGIDDQDADARVRFEEAQGLGRAARDQEVIAEGLQVAQGPQPAQGVVGK